MSDSDGRAKGMEIPETVEDLADILLDQNYLADRGLATATYLALCLGRPLLLEGEAGVGKTELAKALASAFGRAGETAKMSTLMALFFRKSSVSLSCAESSLAVGSAVFAAGKRWECTNPAILPASLDAASGMWQSAHCCGSTG